MGASPKTYLRYLIGGLLIGGFWYLNQRRPPWEEAARTIAVFALVLLIVKFRLQRKSIELHLIPLLASKVLLVIAAAVAETLLTPLVGDPAAVTAIGLGLALAVLGPLGDRHFFIRKHATTPFTEDPR